MVCPVALPSTPLYLSWRMVQIPPKSGTARVRQFCLLRHVGPKYPSLLGYCLTPAQVPPLYIYVLYWTFFFPSYVCKCHNQRILNRHEHHLDITQQFKLRNCRQRDREEKCPFKQRGSDATWSALIPFLICFLVKNKKLRSGPVVGLRFWKRQ